MLTKVLYTKKEGGKWYATSIPFDFEDNQVVKLKSEQPEACAMMFPSGKVYDYILKKTTGQGWRYKHKYALESTPERFKLLLEEIKRR